MVRRAGDGGITEANVLGMFGPPANDGSVASIVFNGVDRTRDRRGKGIGRWLRFRRRDRVDNDVFGRGVGSIFVGDGKPREGVNEGVNAHRRHGRVCDIDARRRGFKALELYVEAEQ